MEYLLHPDIYSTSGKYPNLMSMLEQIWIKDVEDNGLVGNGTVYILSGFSNFNGGVRFYNSIERHIDAGGRCRIILGASKRQRMSSIQIVEKLLSIGCEVNLINRKAIFHAKCYGFDSPDYKNLIVSSGNFTSRGLTQNIEASLLLENSDLKSTGMNFEWESLFNNLRNTCGLDYYRATADMNAPFRQLLFDENYGKPEDEKSVYSTLLLTLSHSDTARIRAPKGSGASLGSQYFWLSKDCIDFFPALDMTNLRGYKKTYQTLIQLKYIDLNNRTEEARVTFEAENNSDFRLGTGILRGTGIARPDDLAAITRTSEREYELRIIPAGSDLYSRLLPYAANYIGHRGKRYGFLDNDRFYSILHVPE